jgi:c-di-GMP-related signal transduction protein
MQETLSEEEGLKPQQKDSAGQLLHCIARQPILDVAGHLHGYELLFRGDPHALAFQGDGIAATRSVLDNTLLFGLEHLSGGNPAFVNCTQEALENQLVAVLPPQQTVLEILETLKPTTELYEACRTLKSKGFTLALDDFLWHPEWDRFLDLVAYIKVDLSITTPDQRAEIIRRVGSRQIRLLAERVETPRDLQMATREGFTLFQGYYFSRPTLLQNHSVPANRLMQIEMLVALQEHPLNTAKVVALTKRDAALTYRLLRMVNSPLYGVSAEISSIRQALVLIGDEMFRRITTLAIASELRGHQSDELLRMAYSRGRFCETAAPLVHLAPAEQYLLGILSLLPAMLHLAMDRIVKTLPLRPQLRAALLGEPVPERALLDWLLAYESAQWDRCDALAKHAGWQTEAWPQLYADALQWAEASFSLTQP